MKLYRHKILDEFYVLNFDTYINRYLKTYCKSCIKNPDYFIFIFTFAEVLREKIKGRAKVKLVLNRGVYVFKFSFFNFD